MVPESIKHKIIRLIAIYLLIATALSLNFAADDTENTITVVIMEDNEDENDFRDANSQDIHSV